MSTNKLREQLDEIIAKVITRETHKGTVNRVRHQLADQILEAVKSSLPEEYDAFDGVQTTEQSWINKGWNAYRDEVKKLLEGGE